MPWNETNKMDQEEQFISEMLKKKYLLAIFVKNMVFWKKRIQMEESIF